LALFREKPGQLKRRENSENARFQGRITFPPFLTWQEQFFRAASASRITMDFTGEQPKSGEGRNPAAGIGAGHCFKKQIKAEASASVFFGVRA
jgi:hypothetical protein